MSGLAPRCRPNPSDTQAAQKGLAPLIPTNDTEAKEFRT